MNETYVVITGFLAGLLTTISFIPQLVKVVKTGSARDLSLGMYILFSSGVALWLVYGIFINAWPVIISNLVTLILSMIILICKLRESRIH
ncbi:MAG: SemiSWEET transporter [Nitrospinota bacterium]|nr:SemiSWEET transporter [Nitrospinota bacterium]